MAKPIHVQSLHGLLIINERGYIQSLLLDTNDDGSAIHLSRIICFDVYEWMIHYDEPILPASIDMRDLGYWYNDAIACPRYAYADYKWRKGISHKLSG